VLKTSNISSVYCNYDDFRAEGAQKEAQFVHKIWRKDVCISRDNNLRVGNGFYPHFFDPDLD
jgi:hypothetical protein